QLRQWDVGSYVHHLLRRPSSEDDSSDEPREFQADLRRAQEEDLTDALEELWRAKKRVERGETIESYEIHDAARVDSSLPPLVRVFPRETAEGRLLREAGVTDDLIGPAREPGDETGQHGFWKRMGRRPVGMYSDRR